ncbi:MAG TPA: primosomal protein N' [Streptosporangiaceae bacterium]|nr:primosomal protein N' [Streptosporangiaceae bacterium]
MAAATSQRVSPRPGGAGRAPEARKARRAGRDPGPDADVLPVARVAVDIPLAHLDRPFDYLVPQRLAEQAVAGCRVRVRFSGKLADGYLLERAAASEHPGRLARLERVVSPEPVLSPEIMALAREVADRYAGTMADVLRLAIPPRHARTESAVSRGTDGDAAPPPQPPGPGPWSRYPSGGSFIAALASGRGPRAVWSALPGPEWPEEIARAAGTVAATGRGVLIVVPDGRDLGLVDAALAGLLGPGRHVSLAAGLGPAERYRRWLAVRRGAVRVVAGTRAAMFAPVADLGLVVIWDDGDDLHAEPRAPYPHAREVLALRAHRTGAAALIGGFARTAEATSLVASGWALPIIAARATLRDHAPQVRAAGSDAELARDEAAQTARLPSLALRTAREALGAGPVLVQVPRRGYLAALGCERCRERARCAACGGPLSLAHAGAALRCDWCAVADTQWRCPRCAHPKVRALVTGAGRTAEELGRAFPGVPVLTSGGAASIPAVPGTPALVIATPGAEPRVEGGYAAALLLDGWVLLGRPSLRAAEEALRRWLNAAALVRCGSGGGRVVVVADSTIPAVQALVRWDPVTHAERELAERTQLRFPPAARMASLTGPANAVEALLAAATLPDAAELLGPVEAGPDSFRILLRVPRSAGLALASALREAQAARSARKEPGAVRVQLDPAELI